MSKFNQYYCKWSDTLLLSSEEDFGLIASSTRNAATLRGLQNFVDKCCLNIHSSVPVQQFCYSDELESYILAEVQPDVMGKNPVPGLPLFIHIYTMINENNEPLEPDDYLSPDVFDKDGYEGQLSERSFFGCPYAIEDIIRMYNFNGPSLAYFFTRVLRTVMGVDEPLCICVNNKPAAAFAEISRNIMLLIHSMLPDDLRKMADYISFDEAHNEKGFTFYFRNNTLDTEGENVYVLGDTFDIDLNNYIAKFAMKFTENVLLKRNKELKEMIDLIDANVKILDGHTNAWEKLVVLMISKNDAINLDDDHYSELLEDYKVFLEEEEEPLDIWINALFGLISNSKSDRVFQDNSDFIDYIIHCEYIDDENKKAMIVEDILSKMFIANNQHTIEKIKEIGAHSTVIAEEILNINSNKSDSFAARVMFKEVSTYDEMKNLIDNYSSYLGSEKYGDFIAQSAFNIFFNGRVLLDEKLRIAQLVVENEPNGRFKEKCCDRIAERASVSRRLGVLYKYLVKNNVNKLFEHGYFECNEKVKEEVGKVLEAQLSVCMSVEDIQEVIKEANQVSEALGGNCCDDKQISEGIFELYSSDFIDKTERRRIADSIVSLCNAEVFKRKCGEQISAALTEYKSLEDIVARLEKVDTENLVKIGAVTFEQKTINDIGDMLGKELNSCADCDSLRSYLEIYKRIVTIFGEDYWDDGIIILKAFELYSDKEKSGDEKVSVLVLMESSTYASKFKEYLVEHINHQIEYSEKITDVVDVIENFMVQTLIKKNYIKFDDSFIQNITDVITYQVEHCETSEELIDISDAMYKLITTFGKNYWDNGCIADGVFHLYCDVLKDKQARKEVLALMLSQNEKNRFKLKCNAFIKEVTEKSTQISQFYDILVSLDAELLGKENYIECDKEMQDKIAELIEKHLENSETADDIIYTTSAIEQIANVFGKNYWNGDYVVKGAIKFFAKPQTSSYEKRKIFSMMNSSDDREKFQKLYAEYFVSAIENAENFDKVYEIISSFETKTVIKSGYIQFTDGMKKRVSECLVEHIQNCVSVDDITDAITAIEDISDTIGANYWSDGSISEGAMSFYARNDISDYDKKKIYTMISQSAEKEIFFSMYGSYVEEMLSNLEDLKDISDMIASSETKFAFENKDAECNDAIINNISKAIIKEISKSVLAESIGNVIDLVQNLSEVLGGNYWNDGTISKGAIEFFKNDKVLESEKSQLFNIMLNSSEKEIFMSLYAEYIYELAYSCDNIKDIYNLFTMKEVKTAVDGGYIGCTQELDVIISNCIRFAVKEISSIEDITDLISIIENLSELFNINSWFNGDLSNAAVELYADEETNSYNKKRIFDLMVNSPEKEYFMESLSSVIKEILVQSDDIEYLCNVVSMKETTLVIENGYLKYDDDIGDSIEKAVLIKLSKGKVADDISNVKENLDTIYNIFGNKYWINGLLAKGAIKLYSNAEIPAVEKKRIFDLLTNSNEKEYFFEFYADYIENYMLGDLTLDDITVLLTSNEVKTIIHGKYLKCTEKVKTAVTNALVKSMKGSANVTSISEVVKHIELISKIFGHNYWQDGSISKGAIAFYSRRGINNYEKRKLFNLMVNSDEKRHFLELYGQYVNDAVKECTELDDIYNIISSFETKTAIENGFVRYGADFKKSISKALIKRISESTSADDITDVVSTIEEISEIIGENYWQDGSVARGALSLYFKESTPVYERKRIFNMMIGSDENSEFQKEFAKYAYNQISEAESIEDILDLFNSMEYKYSIENNYIKLDSALAGKIKIIIKTNAESCNDSNAISRLISNVNSLVKLFGKNYWSDGCIAERVIKLYYSTENIKEKSKILDVMQNSPDNNVFVELYSNMVSENLIKCNSIDEMNKFVDYPDAKMAIENNKVVCDDALIDRITELLNYALIIAENSDTVIILRKSVNKISKMLGIDYVWNSEYYENIVDKLINATHISDMIDFYNRYYPICTDNNRISIINEFIDYLETYNISDKKVKTAIDFIEKLNDEMEGNNVVEYTYLRKVVPIPYQYSDDGHKVKYVIDYQEGEYQLYNPLRININKKPVSVYEEVVEEPIEEEYEIEEEPIEEEYEVEEEPIEEEYEVEEEPIEEEYEVEEEPIEEEYEVEEEPVEEEYEVEEEPTEEEYEVEEEPIEEEYEAEEEPTEEEYEAEEEPTEEKHEVQEISTVEEKPVETSQVQEQKILEEPKKRYTPKLSYSKEKLMQAKQRVQEELASKGKLDMPIIEKAKEKVEVVQNDIKQESSLVNENNDTHIPNKKAQNTGRPATVDTSLRKSLTKNTQSQKETANNNVTSEPKLAQREVLSVNKGNNSNNNEPLITISKREPVPEIVKEKEQHHEVDVSVYEAMSVQELLKSLYSSSEQSERAVIAEFLTEKTKKNDILQLCDVNVALKHHGFQTIEVPYAAWVTIEPMDIIDKVIETGIDLSLIASPKSPKYQIAEAVVRLWVDDNLSYIKGLASTNRDTYELAKKAFFKMCIIKPFREVNIKSIFALCEIEDKGKYDFIDFFMATRDNKAKLEEYISNVERIDKSAGKDLRKAYKRYTK